MATLSSSSTDAAVKAAYDDNSGYDIDGSITACRIFIQACRILMRRLPRQGRRGPSEFQLTPEQLRKDLEAAVSWHGKHSESAPTNSDTLHTSFEEFRT